METPFLVFVSSVIGDMAAERQAIQTAIQTIPLCRPWLFEFSPASSLPLEESYLSKVRDCDIFVLLLKDRVTKPVKREIKTAKGTDKPLLVLLWEDAPTDVVDYARTLKVKYASFADAKDLALKVAEAVGDELITGYRRHSVPRGHLGAISDFLDRLAKTKTPIHTDGGALVGRNVNTGGGNFVGRDLIHQEFNFPKESRPESLRPYWNAIVSRTQYLSLPGMYRNKEDSTPSSRPPRLMRVYVDLDTTAEETTLGVIRSIDQQPNLLSEIESHALSALEVVSSHKRTLLLGDPGSGKSTFINHLAYCLAANALEPDKNWLRHVSGWPHMDAVPIIVSLRDFAHWIATNKKLSEKVRHLQIWEFITGTLKAHNLESAIPALEIALDKGDAVVMFDGLDEIVDQRLCGQVRNAVVAFVERYCADVYILTCRTMFYRVERPRLSEFAVFELAPFNADKISRFVDAWYTERAEQETVDSQQATRQAHSLSAALQRDDFAQLARNPLLLTVMLLVHSSRGRLPDARACLYEDAVDVLLWRWEETKKGLSDDEDAPLLAMLRRVDRAEIDAKRVLWLLAYQEHEKERVSGTSITEGIPEYRLEEEFARLTKDDDRNWARDVIRMIKLRAGVLIERESRIFRFPHRSFQEYLAGAYLASKENFVQHAVSLLATGLHWREVIILAAGKLCYVDGQVERTTALLAELCAHPKGQQPPNWQQTQLAGDLLLEVGSNRVRESRNGQSIYDDVRTTLADWLSTGKLLPAERARTADTLGRLGDCRRGVQLADNGLPDIDWCLVSNLVRIVGDVPELQMLPFDANAADTEKADFPAFSVSRYPITVAQFEAFIADSGYTSKWQDCWSEAGWLWKNDRVGPDRYDGSFGLSNHPVVGVSWYEAMAFCAWLSVKLNAPITLPTEHQWRQTAFGLAGRRYPWIGKLTPDRANYDETRLGTTSAVGIFPMGTSPYGVQDIIGNVWEWCRTKRRDSASIPPDNHIAGDAPRVLQGGAYNYDYRWMHSRISRDPGFRRKCIGFRIVKLSP